MKLRIFSTFALALAFSGLAAAQEVVRVSQSDAMKAVVSRVQPTYPAMARQLHLEGAVQVQAHISETGSVEEVKPVTGNAILMNSAVAAMKLWKFTPFTADGKPAKAVAEVSFNFKM